MCSFLFDKFWILIALFTVIVSYVVLKYIESFRYWGKRGVPHLKPWPIVGSLGSVVFRRRNFTYVVDDYYKAFPNKRYFGLHQFNIPSLLITDLDLIKCVLIKDFDHFVDRVSVIDTDAEPLFGKNLFALSGQKWRDMRATLSPSFTGNKIRLMFTLMSECAKQLNDYFLRQDQEMVEVEMKELMNRYTNDVIATCAFGVKCDSINDKDNNFYRMGRTVIKTSTMMWIKSLFYVTVPKLAKKLNIKLLPKDISTFFDNVIRDTIETRKEQKIIRPDMIHLLMEAMKGKQGEDQSKDVDAGFAATDETFDRKESTNNNAKEELTIEDIIAQAFIFFLAGFETASVLLAHCLHELAVNPDVQKRLQDEIDLEFNKSNGKDLDYTAIANMKYLDMVISETLRKWPPAVVLNRLCVKDYLIEGNEAFGEKPFMLSKGMTVLVSVYGIQRDPKYYPEPDRFDPERFSEKNRDKLVPYTYLPFGLGPRNCIGSRFALLETKILLTYILWKFEIVPTSKTIIPMELTPETTSPCPKGFWLGLKKR